MLGVCSSRQPRLWHILSLPCLPSLQALVEPPSLWQNMDTYAAVADYINTIRKQRPPLITPTEAAHISPEDLRQARVVSQSSTSYLKLC